MPHVWSFRTARDCDAKIIVSPIGNKGSFAGGSQQTSPRAVRAVGKENVAVVVMREGQGYECTEE
ncbi:MAG: hypothetical protein H5T33_02560 [Candidatus Methanosuratus sp.]|nr:hypothetical protein [Candidatus Methanosuratincola sp.]